MRAKEVLAAGVVQDLLFWSQDDLQIYMTALDDRKVGYEVLDVLRREDGSVIIRIVKQYNCCEMIQL